MRDGVRLYTQVYVPTGVTEPLPIIFTRTPYGIGQNTPASVAAAPRRLLADGYIVVLQDIRGRFKSEGTFVMLRQPRDRKDTKAIDESTDTYDTIEWLLDNVPGHNGRVGMVGTSYPAWLAVMGVLDPHPALAAIVPQASPADMWLGDDFHHNGAFRLSYGLEYAYMMESSKEITSPATLIDRYDTYEWYLELGSLANAEPTYSSRESLPTWNDFVRSSRLRRLLEAAGVRAVAEPRHRADAERGRLVGPGRFLRSHQDLRAAGTARHARARTFSSSGRGTTAAGRAATGRKLGRIDFGSDTAAHYRRNILAPFFAHYLKGKGSAHRQRSAHIPHRGKRMGARTIAWPPDRQCVDAPLYFHEGRKLSFAAPAASAKTTFDSYVSDPANPVPYRPRPIRLREGWGTWLVEDQRFVHRRPGRARLCDRAA